MKPVEDMSWQERHSMAAQQGYRYLIAAKKCFELAEVANAKALQEASKKPKEAGEGR